MMLNLNTQHITKYASIVSVMCVRALLTGPADCLDMNPVSLNIGHKAKGPPKGY
jgi:hypothetical protein